uniref:Uncharacterized protein n=1 Tax=Micrurus lemniscatus lemniscatus TaxID=129467 RepID=A0A2D4IRS2_MICLE
MFLFQLDVEPSVGCHVSHPDQGRNLNISLNSLLINPCPMNQTKPVPDPTTGLMELITFFSWLNIPGVLSAVSENRVEESDALQKLLDANSHPRHSNCLGTINWKL